jgi:hypothetical protein
MPKRVRLTRVTTYRKKKVWIRALREDPQRLDSFVIALIILIALVVKEWD